MVAKTDGPPQKRNEFGNVSEGATHEFGDCNESSFSPLPSLPPLPLPPFSRRSLWKEGLKKSFTQRPFFLGDLEKACAHKWCHRVYPVVQPAQHLSSSSKALSSRQCAIAAGHMSTTKEVSTLHCATNSSLCDPTERAHSSLSDTVYIPTRGNWLKILASLCIDGHSKGPL